MSGKFNFWTLGVAHKKAAYLVFFEDSQTVSDPLLFQPFRLLTSPLLNNTRTPLFTLTRLIHIEFPLMLTTLWPMKNGEREVGQHSGWGPEATCMHPQDNNTPLPSSSSRALSQKAVYCWANGGAGTHERAQGAGWAFSLRPSHKGSYLTNPGAAGKWSAQQGLFLKTRAHGRRRRRGRKE